MVYVSGDGTVYQERPWGIGKVIAIFWAVINLIIAFFQTLIPGFMDTTSSNNRFGSGGNRGTRGSGGFGGGSYGGRRPPRPPGPGGNIRGLGSLPPSPPPACGSCCGL
uniref:Putative glycine-rich selenoprotein n=1 Tax=Triatoma infestans TaxID=30076 RepID=A0A023EYD8_TRIIF